MHLPTCCSQPRSRAWLVAWFHCSGPAWATASSGPVGNPVVNHSGFNYQLNYMRNHKQFILVLHITSIHILDPTPTMTARNDIFGHYDCSFVPFMKVLSKRRYQLGGGKKNKKQKKPNVNTTRTSPSPWSGTSSGQTLAA